MKGGSTMVRRFILALAFALGTGNALAETVTLEPPGQELPASYHEVPALADAVAAGTLPPVAERLPQVPLVEPLGEGDALGKHGGDLHMLVGRAKDSRLLAV